MIAGKGKVANLKIQKWQDNTHQMHVAVCTAWIAAGFHFWSLALELVGPRVVRFEACNRNTM